MKDDAPSAADEFRKYIRARREELGLSIRQVAKKAGLDSGGLTTIENGRTVHSPRPETIRRLAYALDVPVTELLSRIGYDVTPTPPDLRSYLCEQYGHLPEDAIAAACAYVEHLADEYAIDPTGPVDREDENDERAIRTST
ncbi:helix-turn-helix transcriptional regulator [Actinomadura soli]|uniref:Helix-turn-helix transcriptional regulator n=1 Tax=Actinomadura soli TaxID=2508997 RepID=A0A5C4J4H5_9ACTN|nr:helix-turn-helix transcriptional regulator [Actinomadura soli]TMQ91737.1 helix-turn-helix transcriptional regulator [Actinomadura soli]